MFTQNLIRMFWTIRRTFSLWSFYFCLNFQIFQIIQFIFLIKIHSSKPSPITFSFFFLILNSNSLNINLFCHLSSLFYNLQIPSFKKMARTKNSWKKATKLWAPQGPQVILLIYWFHTFHQIQLNLSHSLPLVLWNHYALHLRCLLFILECYENETLLDFLGTPSTLLDKYFWNTFYIFLF